MRIDWKPLDLGGGRKSPTTKRATVGAWTLTHYGLEPEEFMAHRGGFVIRAKTEHELIVRLSPRLESEES